MNLKYFNIIQRGELFDGLDSGGEEISRIDNAASHRNRDRVLIDRIKTLGEVLRHGLAEPRKIGENLIELAEEADQIEKLIIFGYE